MNLGTYVNIFEVVISILMWERSFCLNTCHNPLCMNERLAERAHIIRMLLTLYSAAFIAVFSFQQILINPACPPTPTKRSEIICNSVNRVGVVLFWWLGRLQLLLKESTCIEITIHKLFILGIPSLEYFN